MCYNEIYNKTIHFTKRGNEKVMKQKMFHVKHFGIKQERRKTAWEEL